MSDRGPDVHVVTIPEPGLVAVVAGGHPVHQIGHAGRLRRLTVHPMPSIGAGEVLDARYGRVVHTTAMGQAE